MLKTTIAITLPLMCLAASAFAQTDTSPPALPEEQRQFQVEYLENMQAALDGLQGAEREETRRLWLTDLGPRLMAKAEGREVTAAPTNRTNRTNRNAATATIGEDIPAEALDSLVERGLRGERIVGGQADDVNEFREVLKLYSTRSPDDICSAIQVSRTKALTAAHCVCLMFDQLENPDGIRVDQNWQAGLGANYRVTRADLHPQARCDGKDFVLGGRDLALVEFERDDDGPDWFSGFETLVTRFNDELPEIVGQEAIEPRLIIVGFGTDRPSGNSVGAGIRRNTVLTTTKLCLLGPGDDLPSDGPQPGDTDAVAKRCFTAMEFVARNSLYPPVGGSIPDTCIGDSGGPLFIDDTWLVRRNGQLDILKWRVLAGITSRGTIPCGGHSGTFGDGVYSYVKATPVCDWFREHDVVLRDRLGDECGVAQR